MTVPKSVWRRLRRRFNRLDSAGYFYPCDGRDAYGEAVLAVEKTALAIDEGQIILEKCSPATYLTKVAYASLYRYHLRKVLPSRAEAEKLVRRFPEGDDETTTARDLAEAQPAPARYERMMAARFCLNEIYREMLADDPKRYRDAVRSFQAYVFTHGDLQLAAKVAHISKTRLYRMWPAWICRARRAALALRSNWRDLTR